MAEKIPWKPSLAIGVQEVDEQHAELFRRINAFYEGLAAGASKMDIARIIGFLESYVMLHFTFEEQLQRSVNYPDYPGHKKEHEAFKSRFADLSKIFMREGVTDSFLCDFEQLSVTWLMDHIGKRDHDIGQFINQGTAALGA